MDLYGQCTDGRIRDFFVVLDGIWTDSNNQVLMEIEHFRRMHPGDSYLNMPKLNQGPTAGVPCYCKV